MLDKGLSAELKQQYEQHKGETLSAQEIKTGHAVADVVARELVKNILAMNLWALAGVCATPRQTADHGGQGAAPEHR